ncbi:MAG TPA: endonuclease [bacterium]|nr:endonuclease [bacterium]
MRLFFEILFALGITFSLFSDTLIQQSNTSVISFSKAKQFLNKAVYNGSVARKTFYCGCRYDEKLNVDLESCGYISPKNKKRSKRVEWEHIVPASAFGKSLSEWKYGHADCIDSKGKKFKGRSCASKMNKKFQLMQADMYNLVPAIGEVNGDRSDLDHGIISGEKRDYGRCDFEISGKTAEPAENIRGDIARIYMYMNSAYPGFGIINEKNKKMFEAWNISDPVDTSECLRISEIEKIQRNQNLIVRNICIELLKNNKK